MSEYNIAFELENMVPGKAGVAAPTTIFASEDGILNCYGTSAITVLEAEAADTYAPGCIYQLVSGASSKLYVNIGAAGAVANFARIGAAEIASAATTALTDITQAGTFTPDYAVQAITNSSPFGFVNAAEAETVISVVQNNKTRLAELEAVLQAAGLIA